MIDAKNPVIIPAVIAKPKIEYVKEALGQIRINIIRSTGAIQMILTGYPCNEEEWAPEGEGHKVVVNDVMKRFGADPVMGPKVAAFMQTLKEYYEENAGKQKAKPVA